MVFLGDLMDAGSTGTDEEYKLYKERFSKIFDTSNVRPKVYILVCKQFVNY